MKHAFFSTLLPVIIAFMLPVAGINNQVRITSCTVVFITPDCDGCDNKDHDTRIRVSVYGAHGSEVAAAYYTEDKEFPDGSENAVPCTVTNNSGSAAAFAQKIIVTIEPNGNDDWVFRARVIFTLSDGTSRVTNFNDQVQVSKGRPTVTLLPKL